MGNEDLKSLNAGKNAFRGFRHQTLYSINRIIGDDDILKYKPEDKEDLSIYQNEELKEIIQVKSYSSPLNLSSLSPENEDSFLKRSIIEIKNGVNPEIKLVSFGPVGPELKKGLSENCNERIQLKNKLVNKYNYPKEDIELLFGRISIHEVSERELMEDIEFYLEKSHVGTDPKMAFGLLMIWIYEASEFGYTIDKEILAEKLNTICISESEVKNYREEYGNSIVSLEPPEITPELKINLEKEFSIGVSARYEHILENLDIIRPEKLEKIKEEFEKQNVVIIRGASGQGKSTLAYRYLHESYPYPFVYNIKSKGRDAFKIVRAMKAISRSVKGIIAVFLDVEPGDTVWPEIVKELSRYPSFEILVTIREEDRKRATLSRADLSYAEIELSLTKSEAQEIYNEIKDKIFVNFEDVWGKFGEKGPLLEFVYLIKQGNTLKDRLESQILRIQKEATEAKEMGRLDILRIVSLNGKYGCKTDLQSLISQIELTNPGFFIDQFQKEYLIRLSGNGGFLEGLHPIRSQILSDLLFDDINPKEAYVNDCLSTIVEEDLELFLLNSFVDFDIINEILGYLDSYNPKKWSGYGNIIKSLLWLGIKKYVEENWSVIDEAYTCFQNAWSFAVDFDLSDAMGGKAPNLFDLPNVDQEKKVKADSLRKRMANKNQIYDFLEKWLESSDLPLENPSTENEWQSFGFSLFWMGKIGIKKDIDISKFNFGKYVQSISLETMGDAMVGLYYYDSSIINSIKEHKKELEERYRTEYKVPLIEDDGEKLQIHFIVNLLKFNDKNEENYLHSLAIRNISFIRKLYPNRKVISSKGYGHQLEFIDLDLDDTIKNITINKFPLPWLTQINSIFIFLVDYHYRPDTWGDYIQNILSLRIETIRILNKLLKNLKKYYKTRKNDVDILEMKNLNSDLHKLINDLAFKKTFPKVAVDQWGTTSESMDQLGKKYNTPDLESSDSIGLSKFKQYIKFERDFFSNLNNFLKQSEDVIIKEKIYKGNLPEEISALNSFLDENNIEADFNRLSVINLFDAFCNLVLFQSEFKKHFKKYSNSLDELEKNEITLFKILSETWRFFAFENFKINKNILKTSENTFKMNESQLIKKLFKNFAESNLDVSLVSKKKDVKYDLFLINVNEPTETFLTGDKFIKTIKNTYANIEYTDLERLILELRFPNFTGILLTKSKLLIQFSINLPLFRAIKGLDTAPIDVIDIQPKKIDDDIINLLEVDKWSEITPKIGLIQKGVNSISELHQLYYHICQLNEIPELDDIGLHVVEDYLKEPSKLIQKDYKAILDLFNFLMSDFEEEIKKDSEISNILKITAEILKFPIANDKKGFVNLDSLQKWNSELKDVSQKMQTLFLKFSEVIIDKHSNEKIILTS